MEGKRWIRQRNRGGKRTHIRSLAIEPLEDRNLLAAIVMSNEEQLVLELINRARAAPAAEAARLGVGLNSGVPSESTITTAAKQPLAPNQTLTNVAVAHSLDMINRDFFSHTNPSGLDGADRLDAAGYPWVAWGENIAWATSMDAVGFHEMLFRSASHRVNILQDYFKELGVGIRRGGEMKGTELFGLRWEDAFITGVAFTDEVVHDNFYTIGESSAGMTIKATSAGGQNVYTTTTGPTGGYSIQVPPGTYTVTATRSDRPEPIVVNEVAIDSENRKVDFVVPTYVPVAPTASADRSMTLVAQPVVIDVLANDTGDTHQVVVTGNPVYGQVQVNTTSGAITYTPQAGFAGLDQFRYQVRGSTGLSSNTVTVQVAVIDLENGPWKNPNLPSDVNASGNTTAEDVIILISAINRNGARDLPSPALQSDFPTPYLDVTGEGCFSARDILSTVNYLNRNAQGEGESAETLAQDGLVSSTFVIPPGPQHPEIGPVPSNERYVGQSIESAPPLPAALELGGPMRHEALDQRSERRLRSPGLFDESRFWRDAADDYFFGVGICIRDQ